MKRIVVPSSKKLIFACILVTSLFALASVGLVVAWIFTDKNNSKHLPFVAGMFLGTVVSGGITFLFIWRNATFVIDRDRIQLRYRSGEVAGQIPYENLKWIDVIERVEEWRDELGDYEKKYEVIALRLFKRDDPDTWWPKLSNKKLEIPDEFEKDLNWILSRIHDRVRAYEKKTARAEAEEE